ncbi:MAG: hypothetical protein ACE5I1_06380 [bacterium]
MSKWQWLAEIHVLVKKGQYSISTGVPVSQQHVLTTGHGIPNDDNVKIELRFEHDFQNNIDWRPAKLCWHGEKKVDAAILEIDRVAELRSFIYSGYLPDTTTPWEGAGYPAASKITSGDLKGYREPKGMKGDFLPGGGQKSKQLDLTVEPKPKFPGLWRGISGSPVVCQSKLIGIVKSTSEDFDGNSLSGIPMWRILEVPEVRKILGHDRRQQVLDQKKKEVIAVLQNSDEVMEALAIQPAMQQTPREAKHYAEALFNMLPVEDFIAVVYCASLEKQVQVGKGRKRMEEILNTMLPLLHDSVLAESTRLNVELGMLLSLPAATPTIAEIIMAGVDGRPSDFRKPVPGCDFPVGTPAIEIPPESGFSVPDVESNKVFHDHMIDKFAEAEKKETSDLNELLGYVNDELEYIAKFKKLFHYRHYFICSKPEDSKALSNLELLKETYPQLVFIFLAGGSRRYERKLSRPLRDFFAARKGEKDE